MVVTATSWWIRAGVAMLTPGGRNANAGRPVNCCVEDTAHCTEVCTPRPNLASGVSACGLITDPLNSAELTTRPIAPDVEHETISAEDGVILSAKDAERFSRSVLTVRPLTYRDCWGLVSGHKRFGPLPAATAARTAMDSDDSVTLGRIVARDLMAGMWTMSDPDVEGFLNITR